MSYLKKHRIKALLASVIIASGFILQNKNSQPLETHIISQPKPTIENWGSLYLYTPDSTKTLGLENVMSGVAEIKPGEQIHPPHQHVDEEFMLILEGEGTWSIDGEESHAQKGDQMYSKPWDWHGLKNTGSEPLKFYFVKWRSK